MYWVLIGLAAGGYILGWLMEMRNRRMYGHRDLKDGLMRQRTRHSMTTNTSPVMRNSKSELEYGSSELKGGPPMLARAV